MIVRVLPLSILFWRQFFFVFEFQRTATERREATLSRRVLEDASFEALMIFDDTHGLVS